jgi:hypothetical protein
MAQGLAAERKLSPDSNAPVSLDRSSSPLNPRKRSFSCTQNPMQLGALITGAKGFIDSSVDVKLGKMGNVLFSVI